MTAACTPLLSLLDDRQAMLEPDVQRQFRRLCGTCPVLIECDSGAERDMDLHLAPGFRAGLTTHQRSIRRSKR